MFHTLTFTGGTSEKKHPVIVIITTVAIVNLLFNTNILLEDQPILIGVTSKESSPSVRQPDDDEGCSSDSTWGSHVSSSLPPGPNFRPRLHRKQGWHRWTQQGNPNTVSHSASCEQHSARCRKTMLVYRWTPTLCLTFSCHKMRQDSDAQVNAFQGKPNTI